ncbi:hypothetical protein QA612_03680 [Evansella sp. AB-P1]|uniref:hypothetical protein n=1 Tax=Evansella sp. AB-P1 TaxID=3037653 RepID=UPI00241FBC23|nr:hypothetical protein [Evansella sp. AB-P1]MDG5786579.1 hypothetical protein [Evansella sp. AB-P1]
MRISNLPILFNFKEKRKKSANESYRLALKVCKEAIGRNLEYAILKDEKVLLEAVRIVEKELID